MNRKYFIGIFFMFALLFAGCTKENMEDCFSGLRLDFYFTFHTDIGNLFGDKVHRVHAYLFDEHGVLQLHAMDNGNKLEYSYLQNGRIITVSNPNPWGGLSNEYVMDLNKVPAGKYKIISWADSGQEDNTTYFHGQMKTPGTHNFEKDIVLGATTMNDFYMFLKCNTASGSAEEIVPEANEIDDLWYGAVGTRHPKTNMYASETVEVKNGIITERHIELIRNTNILKVTLNGIEHLTSGAESAPGTKQETNFKLWVVASDGRYKSDNTFDEHVPSIRYLPFNMSMNEHTLFADIKVLRLEMGRPVLLYIETPDGRRVPSQPIDMVGMLLKARNPETGEYIYNSQSDLDRIYEHPIEVRIGADLEIRIFIGEWEIVNVKPAE